jgi:hypothetical protein
MYVVKTEKQMSAENERVGIQRLQRKRVDGNMIFDARGQDADFES